MAQTCFCKCPWFGSIPAEVPSLGCSCKGLWFQSALSEFPCLGVPRPAEDLAHAYSLRSFRITIRPAEVSGSCLFPLTSQTNAQTHRGPGSGLLALMSQTHAWTHRCPGLDLHPLGSHIHVHTLSRLWLWLTRLAVAPLYLFLSQVCSGPGYWLSPGLEMSLD